ncbi:MAG: glycosyltransferase family 4 protein [Timaviella obliquedivisa GSE-PSE-MK23-08B]|jgi:glycosyltransferase involved in cell wall biosynthesis|nr:glycosyltransferase family 4 protein [Timaviella obliquedivisa GSE-PSE-MK23-08B]
MPPESNALAINLSFVGKKPTGLANYALNLLPELPLSGLTLLAPKHFPHLEQHSYYSIPNTLTPEQGKSGHFRRLVWTQLQLPKIYKEQQFQLLFSPIPEAPLRSICRSVVVVHDLIPLRFPNWKSPLTQYARHYIPRVLEHAEHIICNSIATAQDVTQFFQISALKITPIPLAHNAQHFRVSTTTSPPDRPYFFYIGRPDPYKNLHRVIWALTALSADYQLLIAGSPDRRYTPLLQAQVQELGLTDRVQFLDYVTYDQLPQLYGQAIALVFPSLWEGFGFPVLEAMSCGTPVITSNLSSLPEVAGDAAILVNPYDKNAIATAMQQIAMDDEGRSQLRAAGLVRASQFSWAKTGQATAEVLSQFL